MALQDEHDLIAARNAEAHEVCSRPVGLLFELPVRCPYLFSTLTGPEQTNLIGFYSCPFVHDIVGKVEVLGYYKVQVLLVIFL